MACNNCGKAIQTLFNNNMINENVKAQMMHIHDEGNKGKHEGWESGHQNLLDVAQEALNQGLINEDIYKHIKQVVNKDGNDAKHKW